MRTKIEAGSHRSLISAIEIKLTCARVVERDLEAGFLPISDGYLRKYIYVNSRRLTFLVDQSRACPIWLSQGKSIKGYAFYLSNYK